MGVNNTVHRAQDIAMPAIKFLVGLNTGGALVLNNTVTVIDFDTVHFDPAGAIGTTNYFIAPIKGYYYFHLQFLWQSASVFNATERADIRLYVNNSRIEEITTLTVPDDADSFSNFLHQKANGIILLNKGDSVSMRMFQQTGVSQYAYSSTDANRWTTFSGFLIRPES